jgi:plastocyanin
MTCMQNDSSRLTHTFPASLRPPFTRAVLAGIMFAVLAFGVLPLFAAEPTAQLGAVSGVVAVTHADGSAVQPAGGGTALGPGDRISTVGKASATIELPGIGQIELGADTTVIIRQLQTASGQTIITVELVSGMIVNRLAPAPDVRLDVRIVDPSGQAVARTTGSTQFGVGRDENGNVTVACTSCSNGNLTFPGDGQGLGSGRARTLTARGDLYESRVRASVYDALAEGADPDANDTSTPSGHLLPPGQRTGSRDNRHDDDDVDRTNGPGGPVARILSPSSDENVSGSTVVVRWQTIGFNLVPAAQATEPSSPNQVHVHIFLDVDPTPYVGTNVPIPLNNPNIVHTTNPVVTFQNVPNGTHRAYLVMATGNHVSLRPAVIDMVTFTVGSSGATVTPTPTVSPTATPSGSVDVEATIANYIYLPDPIRIRVGDTVRWTNLDNVPDNHTVTASDLSWTSPVLRQGQTYTRTFTQPGSFVYFCEPHPFMTAFIEVAP